MKRKMISAFIMAVLFLISSASFVPVLARDVHWQESRIIVSNSGRSIRDYDGDKSVITHAHIPETLNGVTIDRINGVFRDFTSLHTVTIPYTVETIGSNTFRNCISLKRIEIPRSVYEIGNNAFRGATSLERVVLPEGLREIANETFKDCYALVQINIPSTVERIRGQAFRDARSLVEVVIPEGVLTLGSRVFMDAHKLEVVTIPASVIDIGPDVFEGCISLKFMYGVPGSFAETYARNNGITFLPIGSPRPTPAPAATAAPTPRATTRPDSTNPLTAIPTASSVRVNGRQFNFEAYNIEGFNYFKLRDLAFVLNGTRTQFEVGWDGTRNLITLTTGRAYTRAGTEMAAAGTVNKSATPTSATVVVNGTEVDFVAYNIDGYNYFQLREVGAAIDFNVSWDAARNTISINSNEGYSNEV